MMAPMARRRPNPTSIQIVVAMLVLLVPIGLISWFFTRTPAEPPVIEVDAAPVVAQARSKVDWPVLAPANLPAGWQTVRARWIPRGQTGGASEAQPGDTVQLGYLTPGRTYIGLDQSDAAASAFVKRVTRDGRPNGSSTVSGAAWQRLTSDDARTNYLVKTESDATVVVSGDLGFDALEAFAGTLAAS